VRRDSPHGAMADGLDLPDAHISFACRSCGRQLQAAQSQAGNRVVCPGCHRSVAVPPAATGELSPPVADGNNDDRPLEPCAPEDDALSLPYVHISFPCAGCGARLQTALSQAGGRVACPSCGAPNNVPLATAAPAGATVEGEDDGDLEVCDPIIRPPISSYGDHVTDLPEVAAGASEDRRGQPRGRRDVLAEGPPSLRRTFFSGVLSGAFCRIAWQRWLALSMALACVLYLLAEAVTLASSTSGKQWFLSLIFGALGAATGLLWTSLMTVSSLTILQETAEGIDAIEWPGAVWIDWIQDTFYVTNSTSLSALAGLGIDRLLEQVGYRLVWSGPVTIFFLLPIVLLSMLETDSPVVPFSLPVLRCLAKRWWAWGLAYLETGILVFGAGWAAAQVLARGGYYFGAALLPPLLVAAIMVYARLWGRLGWFCTQHFRWDAARAEEEEDEEDEDAGE
jgi:DNA-directed RNA polymerase subunit RPC12/RpoP